ncbi:MAG: hypothetical protein IPN90_07880 [Elusimicrobia bacterium]|nr:hypothetical protein [Elusimicrobiota bacterium]
MNNPDLVLMIIQNTKRASRPGADVKKVSKVAAEKNPEMYKLTPNFIKTQMPMEMFLEWVSKGKRLFIMTINPFPYFPNHIDREPKDDVDHVMLSRGDKHVSQSELGSIEFITDAFEAMDTLNSSPSMGNKIPFHLGMNGWYYAKDFKAGASQNQAHAHLLRERFPVEHAPVTVIEEINGVKIGHLADPENGPGLVLEANRDNLSSLIQKTHAALSLITAKGDSFNILAFPVGEGYRVVIADKVVGVPTNNWFQNEFAFTESCGRAIIADDPRKVFKFTDAQTNEFKAIDQDNKSAMVQWVKDENEKGNLTINPELFNKALADIVSVSAPPEEIEALARQLVNNTDTRAPPGDSTGKSSLGEIYGGNNQTSGMPIILAFLNIPLISQTIGVLDPSVAVQCIAAVPWMLILGVLGGVVLVAIMEGFLLSLFFWKKTIKLDEQEGIDYLLGSGLAHRTMAKILFVIARNSESQEVARIAVRHLVAPWRNFGFETDWNDLISAFKGKNGLPWPMKFGI